MSYQILTTESVIPYLQRDPVLASFLGNHALSVQEIGDGNLNLVFLITAHSVPEKKIILKQALPYLRCVGESYPLSKERMSYEIAALRQFAQHTPQHVPAIYHADNEMSLVAMQYLSQHVIMRQGMIKQTYYPQFAEHMSTFLAENLFKTSSFCLNSREKAQLITQFNANGLRELTEEFVFTCPFMPHETNHIRLSMQQTAETLWQDLAFKKQVLGLKDLFMNKADALLHGDLHTGSIMLTTEETYVIDPEFAFVGPFGFDLGALLANLIMSWVSHVVQEEDSPYADWILTVIHDLMQKFEQKYLTLWRQTLDSPFIRKNFLSTPDLAKYQQQFMRQRLQESIGFAGCKMARRMLGIAGVEDIRGIKDEAMATRAETTVLTIARDFVVNYQNYHSTQAIEQFLRQFQPEKAYVS